MFKLCVCDVQIERRDGGGCRLGARGSIEFSRCWKEGARLRAPICRRVSLPSIESGSNKLFRRGSVPFQQFGCENVPQPALN